MIIDRPEDRLDRLTTRPAHMKALRLYAPGDVRVEEIDRPDAIAEDEVLLKVEMAGVCGSDIHNFHTGAWISRSPSVPGHEFCAIVLRAGSQVTSLRPGDRVVADSRVPCGACKVCRADRSYLCAGMGFVGEVNDGGFASYTVQKASQLLKLPVQDLAAETAVFAEPLAVALHAVNRIMPVKGETALVAGAGTIGILCAIVLRQRGAGTVHLAESNEQRRDHACREFGLGASAPAPDEGDVPPRPSVCIDATGSAAALESVIAAVARGARISVVGLYRDRVWMDMNAIVEGGMTLSGCAAFDSELHEAVRLLPEIADEIRKINVETIDIDDAGRWYETLASGQSPVQKVLLRL